MVYRSSMVHAIINGACAFLIHNTSIQFFCYLHFFVFYWFNATHCTVCSDVLLSLYSVLFFLCVFFRQWHTVYTKTQIKNARHLYGIASIGASAAVRSVPGTSAAVSKTDRAPTNSTAGVFTRREDACAGSSSCLRPLCSSQSDRHLSRWTLLSVAAAGSSLTPRAVAAVQTWLAIC